MNKPVANLTPDADPLALLRVPFAPHHISKLPKPTKAQTDAVKADFKSGIRCKECGSWHHKDVVHLDYVGHAALTDRLLDADPHWSWEPVAFRDGLPAFDQTGGLWIKLTVGGVTRLGYGHAAAKPNADPGSREKEVIGDALRNAAMRFGAALDLWHKGDLHADEETPTDEPPKTTGRQDPNSLAQKKRDGVMERMFAEIDACADMVELRQWWKDHAAEIKELPSIWQDGISDRKEARKVELELAPAEAALDEAFRGAIGSGGERSEGMAGNGRAVDRAA